MLLAAASALLRCHTTQPPVTKELLAGNYTFRRWAIDRLRRERPFAQAPVRFSRSEL